MAVAYLDRCEGMTREEEQSERLRVTNVRGAHLIRSEIGNEDDSVESVDVKEDKVEDVPVLLDDVEDCLSSNYMHVF